MRKAEEIKKDGSVKNDLIIEVLLDIRDLLKRQEDRLTGTAYEKRRLK